MSMNSSAIADPAQVSVPVPTEVVPHFIGGQVVEGTSGRFGQVYAAEALAHAV